MYKKRAPQLRLRSIFTLKSAPQLRFLYIARLMSHKAMGFAPRYALSLRRAFLNQVWEFLKKIGFFLYDPKV
ncbi:hypothetical protein Hanom_Chr09g00787031 [Helianthus anomalus]